MFYHNCTGCLLFMLIVLLFLSSDRVDTAVWMHYMEKKLGCNYTRKLRAILNNSLRQYPTKQVLFGHLPSITKSEESDMRDTAGEVGTNSQVTYPCESLHMDELRQDNDLEPTYNSSVPLQDEALPTGSDGR